MSLSYTQRLQALPHPRQLYGRARALAIAELAINARPFMRWHTLDPGMTGVARISSGSGDEACVWMTDTGCVVRGFDHESELSPWVADERRIWPGLLDGFPADLANGPRLRIHQGVEDLTFLLWWHADGPWQTGTLPPQDPSLADMDGSYFLLRAPASESGAVAFLSEYYEIEVPTDILGRIPDDDAIDPGALTDLPNLRSLDEIADELASVGLHLDHRD